MAWRIVKQPNGLYARFSEVVDDFTHYNMSRADAIDLCEKSGMVSGAARRKVDAADDTGEKLFKEAIESTTAIHGKNHLSKSMLRSMSAGKPPAGQSNGTGFIGQ